MLRYESTEHSTIQKQINTKYNVNNMAKLTGNGQKWKRQIRER